MKYDFSGYATRNNIKCSDGRIIMRDAFKDNDHKKVPLVWQHDHMSPDNVLGHAMLENRDDGVYAYGLFNSTPSGLNAKELVKNGDVKALSIYANKLKQDGANVIHGAIREVSLVLAGANPGAYIDTVMVHSDENEETEDAEICFNLNSNPVIYHSDDAADDTEDPPTIPMMKKMIVSLMLIKLTKRKKTWLTITLDPMVRLFRTLSIL